jgi:hypothetical protein
LTELKTKYVADMSNGNMEKLTNLSWKRKWTDDVTCMMDGGWKGVRPAAAGKMSALKREKNRP